MGLFDKLKETVNVAVGSVQNVQDPFSDPIVKIYFEIICGMRRTFASIGPAMVNDIERAKKYVEYFLKNPCDEVRLEKALNLFNTSFKEYPQSKTEVIASDFRKSLENAPAYCIDPYYAIALFCQKELKTAIMEYKEILDVIKDNVNYKHFSQGLSKMKYSNAIKNLVISQSFCSGNLITRKLVLEYLMDSFVCRMNSEKYNSLYDVHDDIALLILRALNFEKCKGNADEHKTISEYDYRNFVLQVPYYCDVIEDNPFEKERYISKFVNHIASGKVFYGLYSSFKNDFYLGSAHDYFCDFACNLLWKDITNKGNWVDENEKDISASTDAKDIFNIFCTYFRNPDKFNAWENTEQYFDNEDEEIEEEYEYGYEYEYEYEEDEYDDEDEEYEVYNVVPDDIRSSLDVIDLEDE